MQIRISEHDKKTIEEAASKLGQSVSEFIRTVALDHANVILGRVKS